MGTWCILTNVVGRRENFGGISCEKSRFYAKKILFFQILGGGGRARVRRPWIRPWIGTDYIGQYTSSSHTIVDTLVFERAMRSFLSSTRRTAMDFKIIF
jgi:hypothetical protein